MAVPAGTFQNFSAVGTREDLENAIYNISPTETPFLSMAKRVSASNTIHDWQIDSLASAATNSLIEGDDAANGTSTATTKLRNYTQIAGKYAVVSGTQNAVTSAGRKREMAYQLMKRTQELKRDMEFDLTRNNEASAGGVGTARQFAALESWLTQYTATDAAQTATTTPGYVTATGLVTTAPTDGTALAAIVVADLKAQIQTCWTSGGSPKVVMCGPFNKTVISGFAGIATLYRETGSTADGTRIIGAADIYVSDFGEHRIVPNRFQRDETVFVLDMDYWSVAYLRRFEQNEIAKTGDAEKRQIIAEYTLVCRNPLASGKVVNCTTS